LDKTLKACNAGLQSKKKFINLKEVSKRIFIKKWAARLRNKKIS
jgi:hypothetical protein